MCPYSHKRVILINFVLRLTFGWITGCFSNVKSGMTWHEGLFFIFGQTHEENCFLSKKNAGMTIY